MSAIELPFLFQTRTIPHCSPRTTALRRIRPRPTTRRCPYATVTVSPEESPESFLSQKAREATGSARPKNKASITRTEKQVFTEIFKDIKHSTGPVAAPKQNTNDKDPSAILRLFIQEAGQRPGTLAETGKHRTTAEGGQKPRRLNTSLQEVIKRYPSTLRHKALQVTTREPAPADWPENLPYQSFQPSAADGSPTPPNRGTRDPRHGVYRPLDAPLDPAAETQGQSGPHLRNFDAIKEDEIARGTFRGKTADYVESELKSIATELQECVSTSTKSQSGAFKIWDVCQSRIFPIIKLLDKPDTQAQQTEDSAAEDTPHTSTSPTAKGKSANQTPKKPKKSHQDVLREESSSLAKLVTPILSTGVSPILVTTTLYPTLTLLSLRLLCTNFPTTPFPLALYHSIKTLSSSSRILGLNAHFYNTLLSYLWCTYSSLHNISSLLVEMQSSGIDFNGDTYSVIRSIEEERWTQINTGEGTRGREWWLRPEQVRRFGRIMEWKQIIAGRLQEQGMWHLLAEREYSSDLQAMGGGIAERPRVWL